MGVERVVFYSVCCNECKASIEDWEGEICRLTQNNRRLAEQIARKIGFEQISKNKWLCPNSFIKSFIYE